MPKFCKYWPGTICTTEIGCSIECNRHPWHKNYVERCKPKENGLMSIHFDENNNIIDDSPQAHHLITGTHAKNRRIANDR